MYIYIYQTIYNLVSLLQVCDISRQYLLVQIESKVNIVLVLFYYYYIRIAVANASLKTTVHYLSLIFIFFEVCIT